MAIDLVTPLHPPDLERFQILHKSLEKFWRIPGKHFVPVADDHYTQIRTALPEKYTVVRESEIIHPQVLRTHGWWGQQLRKLAIHKVVTTPFYYCVDADSFVLRTAPETEFIKEDGKGAMRFIPWPFVNWYDYCATFFKLPGKVQGTMLPTPKLMAKKAVATVLGRLSEIQGKDWQLFLADPKVRQPDGPRGAATWVESAVYLTGLRALGIFDDYHFVTPNRIVGCGLYAREKADKWKAEDAFEKSGAPFGLIQSNMGLDAAWAWERVKKYIEG